jgi:hypothetical protein
MKQKTASVPSAITARVRLLYCVDSSDISKVKFYPNFTAVPLALTISIEPSLPRTS